MRIFSAIRKHAIVLTTLFTIIALGFVYLFIYLPNNEKIIREQRFHVLQDIDKNVHAKIDNSVMLLKNLLAAYAQTVGNKEKKDDPSALVEYIKNISGDKFSIIPPKAVKQKDSVDDVHTVDINNKTEEIILTYSNRYQRTEKDSITCQIGMRFSFNQFISFLLPQNVFDDYIIFSNGKTVYETFPAGISYVKGDSLMGINKGMSVSSLHDFTISGKNYKVFLQPVHFSSEKEWVIGGLLADKRYQAEKKQLPFQIILLLITLAFCLIVVTPWIKLFHMGGKDRLTVVDGVFSGLVSMLLISVLFLSFFKYNLPFRTDDSPDSKAVLATKITDAFKAEIDSVYISLKNYNQLLKANEKLLADDIVKNEHFHLKNDRKKTSKMIDSLLSGLKADTSIDHLFWLSDNGYESFRWTKDSVVPPKGNYKAREYFTKAKSKKLFGLKNNHTDTTDKFFLDQIISWTNGSFASVVSIPYPKGPKDDTIAVAAVSFKIKSLSNVILPTGYQFAVIDKNGQVLYHSESSHNLNENLLDKFSAQKELQSSLESHAESTFLTNYLSREYNVKVKPMTDLPYYLAILSDTAYKNTRDLEIYSFTFTMLVLFFFFLIIEMLIIFFASAKRSFFKKHLFDTSWVGPKRNGHYEYLVSTFFNMVTIVCLVYFFPRYSFLTYLFILLFAVSFVTLFLNWLYYRRYKATSPYKSKHKVKTIIILLLLIGILNYAAYRMLELENLKHLMLYELLSVGLAAIIYFINWKRYRQSKVEVKDADAVVVNGVEVKAVNGADEGGVKGETVEDGEKENASPKRKASLQLLWSAVSGKFSPALKNEYYLISFSLMLLTRLIVTSGIPVVFFYIASYNYEQNVLIRYKQAQFAQRLTERLSSDTTQTAQFIKEQPPVYTDGSWISSISADPIFPTPKPYNDEERRTLAILNGFRPDVTNEAIVVENFYNVMAADNSFSFNPLLRDACVHDTGTVMHKRTGVTNLNLKLTSTGLNYSLPKPWGSKGSLFWIFLLAALAGFFFLLKKIIKKLFAVKVPNMLNWKKLDENILVNNRLNELVFVIGPPGVKKKRTVTDKIDSGEIKAKDGSMLFFGKGKSKDNVFLADLINIPDTDKNDEENKKWEVYKKRAVNEKIKLVIVNHFEYNLEDSLTNRHKLNFLESLMLKDTAKIMILSTVHPTAFLDSAFFEEKKHREKNGEDSKPAISGADLDRWSVLLGHYRIVILPLTQREEFKENENSELIQDENEKEKYKVVLKASNGIAKENEYRWSYISGPKKFAISDSNKSTTTISGLVEGVYEFELKITGEDGTFQTEYTIINVPDSTMNGNHTSDNKGDFLNQLICAETERAQFLNKMKAEASEVAHNIARENLRDGTKFNPDELAFKLQLTSHYYYMYLWQSLTKEEKFLLYDLAEDNLVNSFDDHNLSMLISKGIIYIDDDGTLRLFNRGFRNFILTAIGNSEAMKIKERIKDNGNWGKWKTPLMLSFVAILGFLMVSQQEVYTELLTYVGAVGAGIPVFLKLLTLFEKGQKTT